MSLMPSLYISIVQYRKLARSNSRLGTKTASPRCTWQLYVQGLKWPSWLKLVQTQTS